MAATTKVPTEARITALTETAERIRLLAGDLAVESERGRQLHPDLVDALRGSGLLRCGAPAGLGAAEAPPAVSLACAETVARGDAAAGWCVSIALTSSLLAAYLPADGAAETLGNPRAAAAGVWAPRAKARPVDGGVIVSGRWAFCSGITHSDHFFGGCVLDIGETDAPPTRRWAMPGARWTICSSLPGREGMRWARAAHSGPSRRRTPQPREPKPSCVPPGRSSTRRSTTPGRWRSPVRR